MPYRKNYKKNYGNFQKKKWASFLKDITPANVTLPAESVGGGVGTLVTNAAQDATPTPTIIKVKHCKMAFDFNTSVYFKQGFVCITFVPQGYTPSYLTPIQHPEWIMAWRGIETSAEGLQGTLVNLSSSLSLVISTQEILFVIYGLVIMLELEVLVLPLMLGSLVS